MSEKFIQDDAVENLKRSRRIVGELKPVVIDRRTGKILSGIHRKEAGWQRIEYVTTKDDAQAWKLKMHYNVQRQIPPNEFVAMLEEYAEVLTKEGWLNKDIVKELKAVSPYTENYTLEFIPDKYKSSTIPVRKVQIPELPEAPNISMASPDEAPVQHLITCSRCDFKGREVAGYLVDAGA